MSALSLKAARSCTPTGMGLAMTEGAEQGKAGLLPCRTHPRRGPLGRPSAVPAAAVFLGQEETWMKKKPQGAGKVAPELPGRPSTAKAVALGRGGLCTREFPSNANS